MEGLNMPERMVGKQAPRFEMDAVMPNKEFKKVSLEENMKNEKWTILFFYPMDFTFVCPTEITALSDTGKGSGSSRSTPAGGPERELGGGRRRNQGHRRPSIPGQVQRLG